MNINQMFGDFLKAADIKGQRVMVTMESISIKKIGDDGEEKPVLRFIGKDKGLVLNKTNAGMIAHFYGPETDDWMGRQIGLHVEPVSFQGRIVDAIRVAVPQTANTQAAQPATTQPVAAQPAGEDFNFDEGDQIPF